MHVPVQRPRRLKRPLEVIPPPVHAHYWRHIGLGGFIGLALTTVFLLMYAPIYMASLPTDAYEANRQVITNPYMKALLWIYLLGCALSLCVFIKKPWMMRRWFPVLFEDKRK